MLSSNLAVNDGVVLRWKHYLAATWIQGPWEFTFAQNFYKGYRDGNDLEGNPHRVGDQSIFDAQIAFTGVKGLRLALGARNLFDKDPPLFRGADSSLFGVRNGFSLGRLFRLGVSKKF